MNTSGESTTLAIADSRSPSTAVIELLAQVEDTDPIELDPLYNTIDPDALDTICDPDSGFDSIEFTYGDNHVTIAATEYTLEIAVEPLQIRADGIADLGSL